MEYSEKNDFNEKEIILHEILNLLDGFNINNEDRSKWVTLEIGGAGGILSGLLADKFSRTVCTDIFDIQANHQGIFANLLQEKFSRNGKLLNIDKIEFLRVDAQKTPFKSEYFDFIFSLNAFEHIPDPELALREAERILRKNGLIYLRFDPVWTADTGSHFQHYIKDPWHHLLYSDQEISFLMKSNNATNADIDEYKTAMNRKPSWYYPDMFNAVCKELKLNIISSYSWAGVTNESYQNHSNLEKIVSLYSRPKTDFMTRGFCYVIRK